MVFLVKVLVFFIKTLISLGKFGLLDEYLSTLEIFADKLSGDSESED